jgi:hypothetical protein
VATRNDALDAIVDATPADRRKGAPLAPSLTGLTRAICTFYNGAGRQGPPPCYSAVDV